MQTYTSISKNRLSFRAGLLTAALGLASFSLLVAWLIEQLAETLFMNW